MQFLPCLTLPLLILRFFLIDDEKYALTTDNFVAVLGVLVDLLDTRTNFHEVSQTPVLLVMVNVEPEVCSDVDCCYGR